MRAFALFTLLFALAFAVSMRGRTPADALAQAGQGTPAPAMEPTQLAASRDAPPPAAGNGHAAVTLERAPDSHFYLDMQVNGRAMRFLVDTGASSVALSRADARRLGLAVDPHDFTGTAQTASGAAAFAPVRLDSMQAGPLAATDVEAVVLDVEHGVPLLGQSFLRRLAEVSVRGDVMVLR
jgi:aspartyl protease family protein